MLPVYEYFNQPLFGLSTPSYVREQERKRTLETYLKQSDFVRLETVKGESIFPRQHYITDIEDIYLKEVVRTLGTDNLSSSNFVDLSEIFIECYLRQQESLKDLSIKETRYGKNIRRNMAADSE